MLHIKTIPSMYGNGKQIKECDNTSGLQRSGLWKNKSIPFVPLCQSFATWQFALNFANLDKGLLCSNT